MGCSQKSDADHPSPVLTQADIVAIAAAVVAELRTSAGLNAGAGDPKWFTPRELASHLGRSRDWVYRHGNKLGATRLGEGTKPRILFDLSVVEERLRSFGTADPPPAARARKRPQTVQATSGLGQAELLPIGPAGRAEP
jgi:hypothetical protein